MFVAGSLTVGHCYSSKLHVLMHPESVSLFPSLSSILESEKKARQKAPERKKGHDGSKITLDDCWMGKVRLGSKGDLVFSFIEVVF